MPKSLPLFLAKMAKNLALSLRKWHKKNLIGENGGERKINPSANPGVIYSKDNRFQIKVGTFSHNKSSSTLLEEN